VSDREELQALRRMAELEARAGNRPQLTVEQTKSAMSKAARAEQDAMAKEVTGKGSWGTGFAPAMHELGGRVTDLAGSAGLGPAGAAGLGVAANFLGNAVPAFLTSGSVAGAPSSALLDPAAKWLLKTAVKPSAANNTPKEIDAALGTMLRENIYPSPSGMEKAGRMVSKLNTSVDDAVAASPATANVADIASRLESPMKKFGMQVNPQPDTAVVEDVWTKFLTNPHIAGKTDIPVKLAHDLKKGTYSAIGGKAYGEVGSASTEAQKALARGAREEVAAAVPSIVETLKREAALMNVMDVAGRRAMMQGNVNPFGLAGMRADHLPSAALTWADRSAAIKSFLAMQMYGASKPQVLGPLGMTGGLLNPDPQGLLYQK
jgi:hypothetical protein